jgi:prophage maintenance system killer protein
LTQRKITAAAPDWDADSAQLSKNLSVVLAQAERHAARRETVTLALICQWHQLMMKGLQVPNANSVGNFRGPPHLAGVGVRVGEHTGVPSHKVRGELEGFVELLNNMLHQLDAAAPLAAPHDVPLSADALDAAIEVAAWAHSEWARIHPFVNGNGRIARVLANTVLMRYGVPPVLRLRPRPGDRYALAAMAAMQRQHLPMAEYLRALLLQVSR